MAFHYLTPKILREAAELLLKGSDFYMCHAVREVVGSDSFIGRQAEKEFQSILLRFGWVHNLQDGDCSSLNWHEISLEYAPAGGLAENEQRQIRAGILHTIASTLEFNPNAYVQN